MKDDERINVMTVCAMLGVKKATVYRWAADGRFPQPIVLGPRVRYWPREVVVRWLAERGVKVVSAAKEAV